MARASEPLAKEDVPHDGPLLARRAFLRASAAWTASLGLAAVPWARPLRAEAVAKLPARARELLVSSPFVYVSPLRADGRESTCHGEVWFGWLEGDVVLITAREAWKVRALARGLERARIWVGDHGRWKRLLGRNEDFRQAPHFEARVSRSRDAELLDRLMRLYRRKYPEEIGRWEPRMREGFTRGERWLLRYSPIA